MLREQEIPKLKLELSTATFYPSNKYRPDQILIPSKATTVIAERIHRFSRMLIDNGVFRSEDIFWSPHLARGMNTQQAKDGLADLERGSIDIPDLKPRKRTIEDVISAAKSKTKDSSLKEKMTEISNHIGWDLLSMGSESQLKRELKKLILVNQRSTLRINQQTVTQHDDFFIDLLKQYPLLELAIEIDADNHTFSDYLELIDKFEGDNSFQRRIKISFDIGHHARASVIHPNNQVPNWPEQLALVLANRANQYYGMDINPYHEGQQTHHDFLLGLPQYKIAMSVLGRALYVGNDVSTIIIPEFHPTEADKIISPVGIESFELIRNIFDRARDGV